jgi:hypothetical protein
MNRNAEGNAMGEPTARPDSRTGAVIASGDEFEEFDVEVEEGPAWEEYVQWRQRLDLSQFSEDFRADICFCQNCTKRSRRDELFEIEDLYERLSYPVGHPKCVMPAGECPRCGSFSYDIRVLMARSAQR